MATSNLQVNLIIFSDSSISNAPLIRNADISYKLMGQSASNPDTKMISLSPGETRTIYDGTRATSIDNTTAFNITQPSLTENVYRFTAVSGTMPNFRTDRLPAVSTLTVFNLTVNGPISTITATTGPFVTTNIQIGDIVKIDNGSGFSYPNQGKFTILSKTSNSISFKNVNGAPESVTILVPSLFLIYSNGGGLENKLQISDKVIISGGFSPATWGSYSITEVTPTYFEILIGQYAGIPLESGIMPGTGIVFYSQAKKFLMLATQDKISVRCNQDVSDNTVVEPIESNNVEKPGLYIKNGILYKLVIANLGIDSTTVTYSTTE